MVMHFGGGIVIFLIARASGARTLLATLFAVLAVGILWELFEWHEGITSYPLSWPDTFSDLLMDCVGWLVAYGIMGWWERSQYSLHAAPVVSPDQTLS